MQKQKAKIGANFCARRKAGGKKVKKGDEGGQGKVRGSDGLIGKGRRQDWGWKREACVERKGVFLEVDAEIIWLFFR